MERIDKVIGTFEKTDEAPCVDSTRVSRAVISRLPRYHRYLRMLIEEGCLRISSSELSRRMNVTASQIRQDLNCFGGFGQQGYGYNVKYLYGKISELLGVNEGYSAIIIGAGNLGRALAGTPMFERRGVTLLAMFDVNPAVIGQEFSGLTVHHIDDLTAFCAENRVDFAVLATPAPEAAVIAPCLSALGVRGVWNFTSARLKRANPDLVVENIHLSDSLMNLCFNLKKADDQKRKKT